MRRSLVPVLGLVLGVWGCAGSADTAAVSQAAPQTQPTTARPSTQPAGPAAAVRLSEDGRSIAFTDTIWLDNGMVRLGVSPAAGRVVHFGHSVGGENLLWIGPPKQLDGWAAPKRSPRKPYANLGGDKVWLLPQGLWPRAYGGHGMWPPDGVLDGQPWTLVPGTKPGVMTMRSSISPGMGVFLERSFRLVPEQPIAITETTAHRSAPSSLPVMIWTVTQVRNPLYTLLDHSGPAQPPMPQQGWIDLTGRNKMAPRVAAAGPSAVSFTKPTGSKAGKIGTYGYWLAGVYKQTAFVQIAPLTPDGVYLDASSLQVYHASNYTELETLSETLPLAVGESMTHRVAWVLEPVKERGPAELAAGLSAKWLSLASQLNIAPETLDR